MSESSRSHISCLPVVPGSLEFAASARQAILSARPATVAVELWRGLETEYLSAVARLPELSAISWCWTDPLSGEETDHSYLLVEPCDPFVEAIRSARHIGAEVFSCWASRPGRPASRRPLPRSLSPNPCPTPMPQRAWACRHIFAPR